MGQKRTYKQYSKGYIGEAVALVREHVIVLSDWADDAPENIYAKLKKESLLQPAREKT